MRRALSTPPTGGSRPSSCVPARDPRLPRAAILALVAVLGGCSGGVPRADLLPSRPLPCPANAFFARDSVVTIRVGAEGGRIDLTHGHSLDFSPGAVPAGSTYRVRRERPDFAELSIDPVSGAPTVFAGTARLTLNYGACGAVAGPLGLFRREGDTLLPLLGSEQDTERRRVSATLNSFSVYAIGSN